MKNFDKHIMIFVVFLIALSIFCFAASNDKPISIESLTFDLYVDENGKLHEDLLLAKVKFSANTDIKEFSLILSSENIQEFDDKTASKIIYIDQFAAVKDGEYTFVIEKKRIASAIGKENVEGAFLYVKMGGMGVQDATLLTVVYNSPRTDIIYGDPTGDMTVDILDAIFIASAIKNDVAFTVAQKMSADVNCDGNVTVDDIIKLLQHLTDPSIILGSKT